MEAGETRYKPFQAAEGGRAGFSNGGAAGADDNFLKELEYLFYKRRCRVTKIANLQRNYESNRSIK